MLTGSMIAHTRMLMDGDSVAKAMFDQQPHKHPSGRVPDWDAQPDEVKAVFRKRVADIRRRQQWGVIA